MKPINVVILENEKLLIDVLNKAFNSLKNNSRLFKLITVTNCNDALKEIKKKTIINIALLNINIPPCTLNELVYVEDIISKLRQKYPDVTIVLFSSYESNIQIYSLLKTINPDCFLIKSDIDYKEFINAIETILVEAPYYSKTVLKCIRKRIGHNIIIDKIDKSILYYLYLGEKMKDISKKIHLSLSAVESRKRKLKDVFGLEKCTDRELLDIAKEKGFV